jgi:hypothetical protein
MEHEHFRSRQRPVHNSTGLTADFEAGDNPYRSPSSPMVTLQVLMSYGFAVSSSGGMLPEASMASARKFIPTLLAGCASRGSAREADGETFGSIDWCAALESNGCGTERRGQTRATVSTRRSGEEGFVTPRSRQLLPAIAAPYCLARSFGGAAMGWTVCLPW